MRLFFALSLDAQTKLAIEQWRDKSLVPAVNFIPAANYHITLAFMGSATSAQTDELVSATDSLLTTTQVPSITFTLNQCSYWANPGVLWLGPTQWPEALERCHRQLESLGQACVGARKNKQNYQPHVSLLRTKELPAKPIIDVGIPCHCPELCLYESISKRQGVQYQALMQWPLVQNHIPDRPNSSSFRRRIE
mgnify:FL=1